MEVSAKKLGDKVAEYVISVDTSGDKIKRLTYPLKEI